MRTQRTRRSAFTITEMLVATALILFIMAIISQVFASASKTYTAMRVAGDLQERARTGAAVMRRDLTLEHFGMPFSSGLSGPRVGDQRLDQPGWTPSKLGFFEVRQFGENNNPLFPTLLEPFAAPATDPEGLASSRATSHVMRFTAKLPDLAAADLYVADAPSYQFGADTSSGVPVPTFIDTNPRVNSFPSLTGRVYSRWAEIQYFLYANGDSTTPNIGGTSLPLYSLRRRVRVLAPAGVTFDNVPAATATNTMLQYPELPLFVLGPGSAMPNTLMVRFLGPDDVNNPNLRMPYQTPVQKNGVLTGDDILITDVLSMEIKLAWLNNAAFNDPNKSGVNGASPAAGTILLNNNTDEPYDVIPQCVMNTNYFNQRVFDTYYRAPSADGIDWDRATSTNGGFLTTGRPDMPPLRINVRSIQIKIRVYDKKAEQPRQITIGQEI
jgi:hypothetical protein